MLFRSASAGPRQTPGFSDDPLERRAEGGKRGGAADSNEALELLCRAYWQPLYVYVRRLGFSPEDAQDLTQAFFERLLEKGYLSQADRERGRFRSFLLASLRHFVSDEMDRVKAWKRGGRAQHVPLEPDEVESQFEVE